MFWSLNARASATMTGLAAGFCERTGESRPALGLVQSDWPQPARSGGTSGNMCDMQGTGRRIDKTPWSRNGAQPDNRAIHDLLVPRLVCDEIREAEAEKTVDAGA